MFARMDACDRKTAWQSSYIVELVKRQRGDRAWSVKEPLGHRSRGQIVEASKDSSFLVERTGKPRSARKISEKGGK